MSTFHDKRTEEVLIVAKTYPQPSSKYRETSCVAAINRDGELRCLFPIPFRLLSDEHKFPRWSWVRVAVSKTSSDPRPESRHIDAASIEVLGSVDTKNAWAERLRWLEPHMLPDFQSIEMRRRNTKESLGFFRPPEPVSLKIKREKSTLWSKEQMECLTRSELFDSEQVSSRCPLRKIPYRFYYRYELGNGQSQHLKINDWEVGALYWRCLRKYGDRWEEKFREKVETGLHKLDLILLMGNIKNHPHRWIIGGIAYPPKSATAAKQIALPFGE